MDISHLLQNLSFNLVGNYLLFSLLVASNADMEPIKVFKFKNSQFFVQWRHFRKIFQKAMIEYLFFYIPVPMFGIFQKELIIMFILQEKAIFCTIQVFIGKKAQFIVPRFVFKFSALLILCVLI